MFRNSICNNLAGSANIDGIASIHIIFYTTCNFRFLSEDDFWQGKHVLNMLRFWLDCRTVFVIYLQNFVGCILCKKQKTLAFALFCWELCLWWNFKELVILKNSLNYRRQRFKSSKNFHQSVKLSFAAVFILSPSLKNLANRLKINSI